MAAARRIEQRRQGIAVAGAGQHVHSGEDDVASLAEDLLGSEEASPSGEDGNTSSVAEEAFDSHESPCCPKAQQANKDQPVEASTKEVSLDPLSGEDKVAEEALDSAMSPSVSKAPTAVTSKDQPGETSPKEESLDPHSREDSLHGQKIHFTLDCWRIDDKSTLCGKLRCPELLQDGRFIFMRLLIPLTSSTPLNSGDVVTVKETVKGHLMNYSCLLGEHEMECSAAKPWQKRHARLRKDLGGFLPPMTNDEQIMHFRDIGYDYDPKTGRLKNTNKA